MYIYQLGQWRSHMSGLSIPRGLECYLEISGRVSQEDTTPNAHCRNDEYENKS